MVLMGQRRPEQGHDAIAHDLVYRPLVAVHGGHQALEHRVEELPRLLRVAVGEQLHRALQVGEEHAHLLALAFEGGFGGEDLLDEMCGRVCARCRRGLTGGLRPSGGRPGPYQHCATLVDRDLLGLDKLGLEIFEVVIIEIELPFEGTIGHAASTLEHGNGLIQKLLKGHG